MALIGEGSVILPSTFAAVLNERNTTIVVSTASLCEIAIKVRSGKLQLRVQTADLVFLSSAAGFQILPILPAHVLADVAPEPPPRDPFDRLLLAQASCEHCALMTMDRALAVHPLAWQAQP